MAGIRGHLDTIKANIWAIVTLVFVAILFLKYLAPLLVPGIKFIA